MMNLSAQEQRLLSRLFDQRLIQICPLKVLQTFL